MTELYYYFATTDRRLGHGDGRKIVLGETHTVDVKPRPCHVGLHASRRAIDALHFAPGPVLYRVTLGGGIVHQIDKACATERTYVSGGVDVSDVLWDFARRCALDVVHMWNAPDVVVRYLRTGDESLRVAARDAARDAARAAARAAGWDAGWDAARAAARAAARVAARDAAWDAAWDAARDRQNRRLSQMLGRALREARND